MRKGLAPTRLFHNGKADIGYRKGAEVYKDSVFRNKFHNREDSAMLLFRAISGLYQVQASAQPPFGNKYTNQNQEPGKPVP